MTRRARSWATTACIAVATSLTPPMETTVFARQTSPERASEDTSIPEDLRQRANFPTYTVMPNDVIEVIYNLEYRLRSEDYVLDVLDEIEISVLHHAEVGGRYRIRTDGKITLPYKGSITVAGLTVDELIEQLEADYSDIFRDPEIFIKLTEFGAKVEELKRIVSSERRGQIFETRVRTDGTISLPIVGDISASGLTIEELTDVVRDAYRPTYNDIGISIILGESPSNVFYVLGEVDSPGRFSLAATTTVSQALALAGVNTNSAGLGNVIVVSMADPFNPVGTVVDLDPILKGKKPDKGRIAGDMILARNDVIFVPKTRIAKINQFVEQYIRNLIMFNGWQFVISSRNVIN